MEGTLPLDGAHDGRLLKRGAFRPAWGRVGEDDAKGREGEEEDMADEFVRQGVEGGGVGSEEELAKARRNVVPGVRVGGDADEPALRNVGEEDVAEESRGDGRGGVAEGVVEDGRFVEYGVSEVLHPCEPGDHVLALGEAGREHRLERAHPSPW